MTTGKTIALTRRTLVGKVMSLLLIGDWNAKLKSQETPGVTGKFGLGIRNEAGQRLTEFYKKSC